MYERVAREKSSKQAAGRPCGRPGRRAEAAPEAVCDADDDRVELGERARAAAEGSLWADRTAAHADLHRARISVVCERMDVPPGRAAEHGDERRLTELGDVPDGADAAAVKLGGRDEADAPEALDRQRVEEGEARGRRHDEQAVRLRHAARHLGQELRPRDADGDRQADLVEHAPTKLGGNLGGRACDALQSTNIEEGLVDREPFDERGRVLEDGEDGLARVAVGRHPRRHDDCMGAEAVRLPPAHRRPYAVGLRLVARREHDTGADDHGLSRRLASSRCSTEA